jgi:LPPG:FO 2-phospho-L-lactate transferase
MTIVALAGGIGAAKLCEGLYAELGKDLTIITNVGDDDVFFGLNVSSDLDIKIGDGDWRARHLVVWSA